MDEKLRERSDWADRLRDWEVEGEGPTPGEALWDRIADSLPRKKKRRWWLPFILIGGLFAVGVALQRFGYPISVAEYQLSEDGAATTLNVDPGNELAREEKTDEISTVAPVVTRQPDGTEHERSREKVDSGTSIALKKRENTGAEASLAAEIGEGENIHLPISYGSDRITSSAGLASERSVNEFSAFAPAETETATAGFGEQATMDERYLPVDYLTTPFPGPLPERLPSVGTLTPNVARKPGITFGLGGGLLLNAPLIESRRPSGTIRAVHQSDELATGYVLSARLAGVGRWGMQLGYAETSEQSRSLFRIQRFYDPGREEVDPNGEAKNTFALTVDGQYGKSDTEIDVVRPGNLSVNRRIGLRIEARLLESVKTTQLPLLVTYDWPISSRIQLRSGVGLAWNRLSVSTNLDARLQSVSGLSLRRTRVVQRDNLLKQEFYAGLLSAGLVYRPFDRWEVGVSGNWATGLGNVSGDRDIRVDYRIFGVRIGVLREF